MKKHQQQRQLSQLNETSNDFIFGHKTNAKAIGKESWFFQTSGLVNNFGSSTIAEKMVIQDHFFENKFAGKVKKGG